MMNKTIFLALTAIVLPLTACTIKDNGTQRPTEVAQVGQVTVMNPFDELDLDGGMNVVYQPGDSCTVRVDAATAVVDQLAIYVTDRTLHLGTKSPYVDLSATGPVTVYVTSPSLEEFELAGAGNFTAAQPLNATDVHIELTGSGNIDIAQLTCNDLDIEVTGSGNITLGMVKAIEVDTEITGSGNVTYKNVTAQRGESQISGSGTISLSGHIDNHIQQVTGSGVVDTKGLK